MSGYAELSRRAIIAFVRLQPYHAADTMKSFVPRLLTRWPNALLCVLLVGWAVTVHAESVTYADLAPIFNTRCTLCHAGASAPLGLSLDSYANVIKGSTSGPVVRERDPDDSELIRRLKGTSLPLMPMTGPPFLSDAEIKKFEAWIRAGMPEGAGSVATAEPVSTPLPGADEPVTYAHVAPIFARRCAKCHTDNGLMGAPPEGYRLTSLEQTLSSIDRARVVPGNTAASELVRRIRGDALPRMPLDGPPYLSEDETNLIVRWVNAGARDVQGNLSPVPIGAKVRLHGRLGDRWTVDDLQLQPAPRLRVDKSPVSGDYVEVRGRVMSDGNVEAERIRRR